MDEKEKIDQYIEKRVAGLVNLPCPTIAKLLANQEIEMLGLAGTVIDYLNGDLPKEALEKYAYSAGMPTAAADLFKEVGIL
ncbi:MULTISPECIES: hypothetical protein [Aerococcus]|uniref:Uncharacterized protein n=1 Tax=Aerococcus urinae TaxID=1376 RepID=A0A0X8FDZ2_9LACT|nr:MULTISPECIES: hypothetical protein [Aerococcus]AMB95567.1 hypothetical protein AWM73_03055 [Aerococcus urinae]MCY3032569.1 hypothetical protein [Aerococcus urinae]MCY3037870.1 hypothetical protein [Aerococcus urinae]MCY3044615.1 hypothetical protein [Aerococcus urinae]MCY3045752.1 hypothetical protein [Aerococcus urinae]